MEGLDSLGYQIGESASSLLEKSNTGNQLRDLLAELISSSRDLNVRVWLDGIYTDLDNADVRGDWMKGREVYFKVEGKVDGMTRPDGQPEEERE